MVTASACVGLVFGNEDFPQAAAGARRQMAHVVCDFHHVAGEGLYGAVCEYGFVLACKRVKVVSRRFKSAARNFAGLMRRLLCKAFGRVQSRTDRRRAECKRAQRL